MDVMPFHRFPTTRLDTTFVDGEMRISRSQAGDLFILVRDDPNDPA